MTAAAPDLLDLDFARQQRRRLAAPPELDMASNLRRALAAGGISPMLRRLRRATRGPGRLSTHEFFYYGLYDNAVAESELPRFVGKRVQHNLHIACNSWHWFAACNDKLLWSTIMAGAGLPIPETTAIYSPRSQGGTGKRLADAAALRDCLAEPGRYPLFCKPIDGINSLGALRLEAIDGTTVTLNGGERRTLDEVVNYIAGFEGDGYLIQRVLVPAPALRRVSGDAVASIRFLVLLGPEGPAIESAAIKIPSPRSIADNYWRAGNLLGAIDRASGKLIRAVTGTGASLTVCDKHPDSGLALAGFEVPDYAAAEQACLAAAHHFPGIRTQSWDVAITERGPILLEMNFGGDLNLHQLPHRRGALTPSYAAHLRRCGYQGKLPAD
ncbi:sugar-transfer associated ATP-grasp domain-containing protein [Desertibaculum subflavum]|uniref:sugar-transfer associated ATP-grasp domain-containing protein n=1 Tax=Desertibaculum subflavum TaxID=2268458 RepID=UPI000E662D82